MTHPLPRWARLALALLTLTASPALADEPLRVFLRSGPKTHGPGEHDHPSFLEEWRALLAQRGCEVDGAQRFPTAGELDRTDVLVMYAADAGSIQGGDRAVLEAFLGHGGGIVVIHDAICGDAPQWFKTVVGGAWEHGHSKWHEGEMGLYFADREHPITRGASNFDFVDEIYWDLHMDPGAHVLANSFHTPFDVQPQMWVYEKDAYRAFVALPGHETATFELAPYRTLLLRGIAWAGKRDADALVTEAEVAGLRYPPGGPRAPERAAEGLVPHPDFELSLAAAEPLIINPVSIDWDPAGRMWVACTPGYPDKQEFSGVPAHDYVAILEDTDGDGRMDARKIFHEGLDLVTSLVFYRDGILVTQAPDILWLRDTDRDDRADQVVKLYTGFGFGDTHAVTSNLRWGLDGWVYATQGYSGNASNQIRDAQGRTHGKIGNGLFRFRPDGTAIEMVVSYGSNTWGLDFAADGELFFTMANGSHLRHVILPDRVFAAGRIGDAPAWKDVTDHKKAFPISKHDRPPYQQIDFVGGFTGAAGCLIYDGGAWPEEYRGNHFVTEPTINLVHRDVLAPEGATFKASKPRQEEFLAARDLWFRPVHVRSGPDGALYVLDFYNQAAVHNDTRGPQHGPTNAAVRPDRDHLHGRVWRVQHRAASELPVPDLAQADDKALVAALGSPNGWQRTTAHRLLVETLTMTSALAVALAPREGLTPEERVQRLWVRYLKGLLTEPELYGALRLGPTGVRKNAARIAGLAGYGRSTEQKPGGPPPLWLRQGLRDRDPRVRLATLVAYGERPLGTFEVEVLVEAAPELKNDWEASAALRAVAPDPVAFVRAAVDSMFKRNRGAEHTRKYAPIVAGLSRRIGQAGDPEQITGLIVALAAERGPLAVAGLRALTESTDFSWTAPRSVEMGNALEALLTAQDPEVVLATIPLAAQWDAAGAFRPIVDRIVTKLYADVRNVDAPLERRLESLECLLLIPRYRPEAVQLGEIFLDPYFSLETQLRAIDAVGEVDEEPAAAVLLDAYPKLSNEGRERSFNLLARRAAWSLALLDRVEAGGLTVNDLGPHRVFRLRNHPEAAVSTRAVGLFDAIQGERLRETETIIAELLPIVTQPGDPAAGKELFAQNCATCHTYEVDGQREGAQVGPELTGMGVHGPAELLPFVIDPNRAVEDAYVEYVARTVDGLSYGGVLVRETPRSIVLRNTDGDVEVRREELEELRSTGRSPMPTGLEELGPEALRDIFAYLCAGQEGFRVLDFDRACTASTERGMYDPQREPTTYEFARFGVHVVDGIPFELLDPYRSESGNNVIVLKGGLAMDWSCKTSMPTRVEIPVGYALERVHVLGGVAAWGYPFTREKPEAVRWTWRYADGSEEAVALQDGVHFADWIRPHDVPGSTLVEGLQKPGTRGQVRRFSVAPSSDAVVESIVLESFDNQVAPTFLSFTAQLAPGLVPEGELWDAQAVVERPPELDAIVESGSAAVLVVGGGSSHDYRAHYRGTDVQTLAEAGLGPIAYTEYPELVEEHLKGARALFLANNQPLPGEELRAAIHTFAERGGGLLLAHAATWYNWPDWARYNSELVGGGSRGHERFGRFEVYVSAPGHPVVKGLPESFSIQDELYRFEPDPQGTTIEVLAIGRSLETGDEFPVVWTVGEPKMRVVCTTLGHDGRAHENASYRRLIQQAALWLTDGE